MVARLRDLMLKVDSGELQKECIGSHAHSDDFKSILAYAISRARAEAIFTLVIDCSVHLPAKSENASQMRDDCACTEELPPIGELMAMAEKGDWGTTAYFLAVAAKSKRLSEILNATDAVVRAELQQIARAIRVQLPSDLKAAYLQTGRLHSDLLVEQPHWHLPRPQKDRVGSAPPAAKIEEGWYTVVQYPVGDDLQEIVLRRKMWNTERRQEAMRILRTCGETIFCKAVKAKQWSLVERLLEHGDAVQLSEQLEDEFVDAWDGVECWATLRRLDELKGLIKCLSPNAVLRQDWRRGSKHPVVPAGAKLISPSMEILQEAERLGWPSNEARTQQGQTSKAWRSPEGRRWRSSMHGAGLLHFSGCQSKDARERWRKDAAALHELNFALPLLHRLIHADQLKLMEMLLEERVDVDACDTNGMTALAAAASSRNWAAAELLLQEGVGCRTDGRSGSIAKAAAERASKEEREDAKQAAVVLAMMQRCHQRAPAASLVEYFRRQAQGEIMHGVEPRRFTIRDLVLHRRSGDLQVWARILVVGEMADSHTVVFARLTEHVYATAREDGMLDLARHKPLLISEECLTDHDVRFAVAIALPSACLKASGRGAHVARRECCGNLDAHVPLLAIAPATGILHVRSAALCCSCAAIDGIEVLVDGVRLGATGGGYDLSGMPTGNFSEVKAIVPPRELTVTSTMDGRPLRPSRQVIDIDGEEALGEPKQDVRAEAEQVTNLHIEVGLAIFIYVMAVEDSDSELVYVAGRRQQIPIDDGARPFIGRVSWSGGSTQLSHQREFKMIQLEFDSNQEHRQCLSMLQSLKLKPDLQEDRHWTATAWEDTDACQFERIFICPQKVGQITPPPTGPLHVRSAARCCPGVAIDGVEVCVDGRHMGETWGGYNKTGMPTGSPSEMTVTVPLRVLNVTATMCGMSLKPPRLVLDGDSGDALGDPQAKVLVDEDEPMVHIEVDLAIFIYVMPIEDSDCELVYVAGRRQQIPVEDGARPFVGDVSWDGGSMKLDHADEFRIVRLEIDTHQQPRQCLSKLQSLKLKPKLPTGRHWTPTEWEDTDACQHERIFICPQKVGQIAPPPTGPLHVRSAALCCSTVAIDGVEVLVDGKTMGETCGGYNQSGMPTGCPSELIATVPLVELNVTSMMYGRLLRPPRLVMDREGEDALGDPTAKVQADDTEPKVHIEVDLAIFIYVMPLEDSDCELVYVAGRHQQIPVEDGASPFIGEISWDGGSMRLDHQREFKLVRLEFERDGHPRQCLSKLQSLKLTPELPKGRRWTATAWEDTDACQFERIFICPQKVGQISDA